MPTTITFNLKAQLALRDGVAQLADAVSVTLGPRGRTVVLEQPGGKPIVTKDGVTVARAIELPDPVENAGARFVKEVAMKTNDRAGDGTTTSVVLAQSILTQAIKHVTAGHNPMAIKRGIDDAAAVAGEALRTLSRPVQNRSELQQVASLSANHDKEIGRLVAEAFERVGAAGVVTIEDARGRTSSLEVTEGVRLERGYLSPHFVTDDERMEVVLEDAYVLLTDQKVSAARDLMPVVEEVAREGEPLLVIAEALEGDALPFLVVNTTKGSQKLAAIKAPGFGDRQQELLDDLAVLTGGSVITQAEGRRLAETRLAALGRARRIVITGHETTIVDGAGDKAEREARVQQLTARLAEASEEADDERLRARLARLSGSVALLRIGAATEIEMQETKLRAEDALHATRAAIEEGIVPGGGVAYLRAQAALGEQKTTPTDYEVGVAIVRRTLEAPLRQIAINSGFEGNVVVERVARGDGAFGFDAATGTYGDLLEAGIIDPAKVVRTALAHAASVAGLLFTTEAVVVERVDEEPDTAAAPAAQPSF